MNREKLLLAILKKDAENSILFNNEYWRIIFETLKHIDEKKFFDFLIITFDILINQIKSQNSILQEYLENNSQSHYIFKMDNLK